MLHKDLADTVIGKRTLSYVTSLLVIIIAFAWPFSSYLTRSEQSANEPGDARLAIPIEERLSSESHKGGGDILWSTGPLLPAHQLEIGDDCSACHKAAFEKVQDQTCIDCHQDTGDHFDKEEQTHFTFGVSLCQSCHKEHNEPAMIVVDSDTLCVECHQQNIVHSDPKIPELEATYGFDTNKHPPFRLNFLLPEVQKKGGVVNFNWVRKFVDAGSEQKEVSNLKFTHELHLDPEKVLTVDKNEAMVCSDCHTLKSDNEHFEAITMERHCSQCHDLTFDRASPDRQLPHGEPKAVVQSIEEYFVRVYTDPNYTTVGKERRRRRPGQISMNESCGNTAFSCAMERATNEARIQFTQRGCVNCHEVSDDASNDIYSRWTVLPVKINHNWYARAQFDHLSHLTQQGDAENETCSSCHNVMQSKVSSDVLVPGINNCLNCHGDQNVEEKVNVNCISCHAFHPKPNVM